MNIKNKLLAIFLMIAATSNMVFADTNKDYLLNQISTLQTKISTLKTNATKSLEDTVYTLGTSFDNSFQSLGYDVKTINYLVSLGKITSNFKEDLSTDLNALNKEIADKTTTELTNLSSIQNNLKLNYTTISENEKATFLTSIQAVESNYTNLQDSFSGKILTLKNKYNTSLNTYQATLKSVYSANASSLTTLNTFSTKFDNLFSVYSSFEKNYQAFKTSYLSYAGDLSVFSESKQAYYVNALKGELEKIRDVNIANNETLTTYKVDIDRLIDILLENFKNALSNHINDSYGVIYSDTDINSIVSKYTTAKNRYYDLDGKLKATEVLSSTGSLEEVNYINSKLSTINSQILELIGTGSSTTTYANVKIRLENEMVKYYNDNYQGYREDLLLKLKEKLNIVALEAKNTILASDTIDMKFTMLNDKISKSNDLNYITTQIGDFKKDLAKYSYLNSSIINKKVTTLGNNLDIFAIKKELAQFKYNKMSQTKYDAQLTKIFAQLKAKFPDSYGEKLQMVVTKVNTLLENSKLSDKNRFMLLCVKLNILNYLSK